MKGSFTADLRAFGTIGFQQFWLNRQYPGMSQDSLLDKIAHHCHETGLDIIAITTEDDKLIHSPRNPYPEDRFGMLSYFAKLNGVSRGYQIDILGENSMRVKRNSKAVYIINSQTVHTREDNNPNTPMVPHQVLFSNQVPQNRPLKETARYCELNGLPQFLMRIPLGPSASTAVETAVTTRHCGVIAHEALNVLPSAASVLSPLPAIGALAKYNRGANKIAEQFARVYHLPSIAVSSAHNIENIGIARTRIEYEWPARIASEEDLKKIIVEGIRRPEMIKGYESLGSWFSWINDLRKHGGDPDRFKEERSSYNL